MERNARKEAVLQLLRDEESGAYAGHSRRKKGGAAVDERHITDMISGIVRYRRRLDFIIDTFYSGTPRDLDPRIRMVLRLALHELTITNTPPHAAVNEAVDLARSLVHRGAAGLVNGLLRSVLRASGLPRPDTGSRVRDLAIWHSHPDWIVARWLARWPEEDVVNLLCWNNARPFWGVHDTGLSPRDLKALGEEGEDFTKSTRVPGFLRARSTQGLIRSGALTSGRARIQDEAAALVVHTFADALQVASPGSMLLDVCAAPGGKAIYAALLAHGPLRVVASDLHAGRTRLIDRMARAHGVAAGTDLRPYVETRIMDARRPDADLSGEADVVLVDAPCSGLGVLARRADARWKRTEEDLHELTLLQAGILDGAASCVSVGGLLIYSTCTIEPEENELQVAAFLERHPEFHREPVRGPEPTAHTPEPTAHTTEPLAPMPTTPDGDYLSLPQHTGMDGAYAARLRRRAE